MSALPTAQEALSTALDHLGDMSVEVLTCRDGVGRLRETVLRLRRQPRGGLVVMFSEARQVAPWMALRLRHHAEDGIVDVRGVDVAEGHLCLGLVEPAARPATRAFVRRRSRARDEDEGGSRAVRGSRHDPEYARIQAAAPAWPLGADDDGERDHAGATEMVPRRAYAPLPAPPSALARTRTGRPVPPAPCRVSAEHRSRGARHLPRPRNEADAQHTARATASHLDAPVRSSHAAPNTSPATTRQEPTQRQIAILDLLQARGELTTKEIVGALGWTRATTRSVIAALVDAGKVIRCAGGTQSPLQRYRLAEYG